MNTNNTTAFVMGIAIALIFFGGFYLIQKKCGKQSKQTAQEFDERQLINRDKAFKTGFWTFLIWEVCSLIIEGTFGITFMSSVAWRLCGIYAVIIVFVNVCIWNDAYFSLKANKKQVLFLDKVLLVINAVNLGINIVLMIRNPEKADNMLPLLSYAFLTLLFSSSLLSYTLKDARDKREEAKADGTNGNTAEANGSGQ